MERAKVHGGTPDLGVQAKVTVDDIVRELGSPRGEIVERLRSIVRKVLPGAVETIKWGQPFYVYKGMNLICFMLYDDHINLGFFVGSKMKSKRLEGTGKGLRHVKIRSLGEIDDAEFSRLIKQAVRLV